MRLRKKTVLVTLLVAVFAYSLIGILLLSGTVAKLTKDYLAQRKTGVEPVFRADEYPELKDKINSDIWY